MGTGLIEDLQCNSLFILAMFLGAGYHELVGVYACQKWRNINLNEL